MRYLSILLALLLAACTGLPQAEPVPDTTFSAEQLEATIDQIVAEEMTATHLPGVAIVIVKEGKTVIKRGYGVADVSTGRPVDTEKTLFRIGSVTKALTGFGVSRLIDTGRLSYEADVAQYFDGIPNLNGGADPVTIWNLLTHTGGFDQPGLDRHIWSLDQSLDNRKAMRPSLSTFLENNLRRITPPGQIFRYDTYGITLAGEILGRVTNKSYADAMHQELFAPAGMENSFVEADKAHLPDVALGYGWIDSAYVAQPYEVYVTTPASSIDATPADMALLLEALTGDGVNSHGRVFSKAMADAILSPQYKPHPRFTGVTHNLWESPSVDPPDGPAVRSVGHGGSMLGFWTLMDIFVDKKVAVFMVTNRNFEAGGGPVNLGSRISQAVLKALYPESPTYPISAPVPLGNRNLEAYVGDYAAGTFCQSCSQAELARGAWMLHYNRVVTLAEEGLEIDEEIFLPSADEDVFIRQDRKQEVFFGRDAEGQVSFFMTSDGPATVERVPALTSLREGIETAYAMVQADSLTAAKGALDTGLLAAVEGGLHHEGSINAIGYHYLQNDNLPLALLFFQFNVEQFPTSWNVHDSLGEALALAGRLPEAITAYKRALTLNPQSEGSEAALRRLQNQ